jgi:hypothetical protein
MTSIAPQECPADCELKEYLGYADADLLGEGWFETEFPEGGELRHCLALHKLLYTLSR